MNLPARTSTSLPGRTIACFLLLLWASVAAAFDSAQLTGRWYGESERNGQTHRFLITRNADGSFTMEYRIYIDETPMVSRVHTGEWGVKDGTTYWARTTKITDDTGSYPPPTANGYYEDIYTILSLDTAQMKTRHQKSGNEAVVTKAAEGFVLK